MLVLSRKKDQDVTFPNLGIAVKILRVNGNTVSVGVDAPRDIRVLRGELSDGEVAEQAAAVDEAERQRRHDLRNRLHRANLALHVLQRQLDKGQTEKAEATLLQALNSLAELDALAEEPVAARQSIEKESDKKCRALVVEDNENERELMVGFLELCGYEVDAVGDGMQAMEYLEKQQRPDLVLLDMQMPRMDGPETVSAIRKHPEFDDIKLFVVSGSDESTLTAVADDAVVDHWFQKPINPAEFAVGLEQELAKSVG